MSIKPGRIDRPVASTTRSPHPGTKGPSTLRPTAVIRSPSITTRALRNGAAPVPSMSVPFSRMIRTASPRPKRGLRRIAAKQVAQDVLVHVRSHAGSVRHKQGAGVELGRVGEQLANPARVTPIRDVFED